MQQTLTFSCFVTLDRQLLMTLKQLSFSSRSGLRKAQNVQRLMSYALQFYACSSSSVYRLSKTVPLSRRQTLTDYYCSPFHSDHGLFSMAKPRTSESLQTTPCLRTTMPHT